jgi:hypothetical protein
MPVELGSGESVQDTLNEGETVIKRTDDLLLIVEDDRRGETLELAEIDNEPARVRVFTGPAADSEERPFIDLSFDTLNMARVSLGLQIRCGPFVEPKDGLKVVPVDVATYGQDAIGAYLRLGNGRPRPRAWVADRLDVTEQTVSNYCNRIRWEPI